MARAPPGCVISTRSGAPVVCARAHTHPRTGTPAAGAHASCAAALPSGSSRLPCPPPPPPSPPLPLHGKEFTAVSDSLQKNQQSPVPHGGGAAANAGAHPQPHAGSQDNGNCKLLLLQLDQLHLAFMLSQVFPSVSSNSQDQQSQHLPKSVIPTRCRVTEQLTTRIGRPSRSCVSATPARASWLPLLDHLGDQTLWNPWHRKIGSARRQARSA
jgi:hypothetical protein